MRTVTLSMAGIVEDAIMEVNDLDVPLAVIVDNGWCCIERQDHPGVWGHRPTANGASAATYTGWITDAAVEGSVREMWGLACAILDGKSARFKRCAALRCAEGYVLYSPRNTGHMGSPPGEGLPALIPYARAIELAHIILQKAA